MTYIATAAALVNAGLKVRLVDVEPGTWLMSPEKLESAISPQTRLIVPVHLYGQMAEMDRIRTIADKHDCLVLEDASQAHGRSGKDFRSAIGATLPLTVFTPQKTSELLVMQGPS